MELLIFWSSAVGVRLPGCVSRIADRGTCRRRAALCNERGLKNGMDTRKTRKQRRRQKKPAAKLYDSGQFTLNHAATALLGKPPRVRVQIEPELKWMRLQPATPNDAGAFSLSGGGNSPHRISLKSVVKQFPALCGDYRVVAGGIECIQESES
ncbi:hypothetical protein [Caldilinea sp.]|uniref:hypothetical protein n=1 Tax=Caldilinea sp. TaxID=2293560 RepID=UPI0026266591|nr:hypothetical protein [Caldilinea sp.]